MSKWKEEGYLDQMRREMDPLADEAVKALFAEKAGVMGGFAKLFREDLMPGGKPRTDVPEALQHYLEEQAKPPEWEVDHSLLDLGDSIQSSHGLLILSIMACASLPECYVDWRGMPVLALTQQLSRANAIERRVIETCLYLSSVLSKHGFQPGGKALEATRKVRLMHAAARFLILADDDEVSQHLPPPVADRFNAFDDAYWDEEGQPINQEDLAYTLQTFSFVGVRGLRTLKLGLDRREELSIIHCWRLAGHHMGIRDELNPASVEEAEEMFDAMKKRLAYHEPGDPARDRRFEQGRKDGVDMTYALLDWTKDSFLPGVMGYLDGKVGTKRHILTQEKLEPLPKMLMWHLVGAETAEMLDVPTKYPPEQLKVGRRWLKTVTFIARIREWGLDRIPFFRELSNWVFDTFTGMRWEGIAQKRGWTPFTRDLSDAGKPAAAPPSPLTQENHDAHWSDQPAAD